MRRHLTAPKRLVLNVLRIRKPFERIGILTRPHRRVVKIDLQMWVGLCLLQLMESATN
nr:MAG TPA: hypothetical protein [Caudoviricetes sp.]